MKDSIGSLSRTACGPSSGRIGARQRESNCRSRFSVLVEFRSGSAANAPLSDGWKCDVGERASPERRKLGSAGAPEETSAEAVVVIGCDIGPPPPAASPSSQSLQTPPGEKHRECGLAECCSLSF